MADEDDECSNFAQVVTVVVTIVLFVATALGFFLQQIFSYPGPTCYVQELYVPALDLSAPENISASTNPFLFFSLRLRNDLPIGSVSYETIALTFYYGRKAVAEYAVPSFSQGRSKSVQRRDVVETRGLPWQDALAAVSSGSTAGFRVELAAALRFKVLFKDSSEKKIRVTADVAVGAAGVKAEEDDIKLNSAASKRWFRVFIVLIVSLFITTSFLL